MQVCSPRSLVLVLRILLFSILLASVDGGPSHAAPDPSETIGKVAHDLGLQTEMPKDEPPKKEIEFSDVHWHIPAELAWWILAGAVAIGLAFVLYALRDTFPKLSRRSRAKPDDAVLLPTDEAIERMAETGDDADELARLGRLAEAMHMLLLRSLTELRKRLEVTIADSLTSREILQRLTLPELGHRALADLIRRVEFVHFGRQVAAIEDYRACRASYEMLIDAMRRPVERAA